MASTRGLPLLLTISLVMTRLHLVKKAIVITFYLLFCIIYSATNIFAVDVAPRISDKEIIESLSELKAGQLAIQKRMDDFQESTNNRFDDLQRSTNNRFDDMNKRIDTLQWMLALFITVALSMLGVMGRMLWNQQRQITQIESSLETYKDELAFLKTLIEKLLPPKGVL